MNQQSFKLDGDIEWIDDDDLDAVVLHAPLKSPRASSVDGSTSAGVTSDSETEEPMSISTKAPMWRELPPGFRPPPGLSLPVFAA